uniref:Uncharacterized protein n=1 Tax=Anguilla anguilla TaxID=7936 RepID=A0A0E9VV54_ANGAN
MNVHALNWAHLFSLMCESMGYDLTFTSPKALFLQRLRRKAVCVCVCVCVCVRALLWNDRGSIS